MKGRLIEKSTVVYALKNFNDKSGNRKFADNEVELLYNIFDFNQTGSVDSEAWTQILNIAKDGMIHKSLLYRFFKGSLNERDPLAIERTVDELFE